MSGPICSADGCHRTSPCGPFCRDNGNFDSNQREAPLGLAEAVTSLEELLPYPDPVVHARVERILTALRPSQGWQPIETFSEPTSLSSGNGVLVASDDGTVGEAYFRNYGDYSDGWWWANTSWGDYPEPDRPTPVAWQPLPAPPEKL